MGSCYWLSGMRSQGLLLFSERNRWRRWSFLRDHLPSRDGGGRRGYMASTRSLGTQDGFARGHDGDSRTHRRRSNLCCADLHARRGDRLRAGESVLWHYHDCALHVSIRVGDISDRGVVVDDSGAIDVRHLRDVYSGAANVHAIHVGFADVIRGDVHFARS